MTSALLGLVLGAIAGSFLATVLIRWPNGDSALSGRSECDSCHRRLSPGDLVPILSFLAARGRCRHCKAAIDPRHVAIEAAAAMLGLVALVAHPDLYGIVTALFGWWLLLLAALDAEHQWLPDALTLPLIAAGLPVAWLGTRPAITERLIGAAAGYAALAIIALFYRIVRRREGLGGGDPKLLAGLGAWLGWQQLPLVLLGAGLLGLLALLLRKVRGEAIAATDRLPLGTLMALTAWPIWLLVAG